MILKLNITNTVLARNILINNFVSYIITKQHGAFRSTIRLLEYSYLLSTQKLNKGNLARIPRMFCTQDSLTEGTIPYVEKKF